LEKIYNKSIIVMGNSINWR